MEEVKIKKEEKEKRESKARSEEKEWRSKVRVMIEDELKSKFYDLKQVLESLAQDVWLLSFVITVYIQFISLILYRFCPENNTLMY